jgi:hypothetical protein
MTQVITGMITNAGIALAEATHPPAQTHPPKSSRRDTTGAERTQVRLIPV